MSDINSNDALKEVCKVARGLEKDLLAAEAENARLIQEVEYWKNAYNDDFVQKAIDDGDIEGCFPWPEMDDECQCSYCKGEGNE